MVGTVLSTLQRDLHPMLSHFPIALLVVSVGLDLAARFWPQLRPSAWLTLVLGAVMTLPTTVTGLIAHVPYEDSPAAGAIETHELLAFGTTALFIGLTAWRWRTRRRGGDAAAGWLYPGVALLGLVLLTATGYTGGSLVYDHAVGVSATVPR